MNEIINYRKKENFAAFGQISLDQGPQAGIADKLHTTTLFNWFQLASQVQVLLKYKD